MKIACVTSISSVGCTFVDWSLHFLSNRQRYFRAKTNTVIPLSANPVTTVNAHGHRRNHPAGCADTVRYIKSFQEQKEVNFCSMYPQLMHADIAAKHLNLNISQLSDSDCWAKVVQYQTDDYQELLNQCHYQNVQTVYIAPDSRFKLYFLNSRQLDRFVTSSRQPTDISELTQELQNVFFQHSMQNWQNQGLVNIWDVRERMALDSRPFELGTDSMKINLSMPHLWINSIELWNNGEEIMQSIMSYLDLSIVAKQRTLWLPIYKMWRTIQQNHLKFAYQFDHIIDSIINNYYYKLDNLTFEQEIAIQHALIYQHNLNLKTWQLSQFPCNTQDIHKLLEPNTHPI